MLLPERFYVIWPCANPAVGSRVVADLGLVDADDVGDEAPAAAPASAVDYASHSSRAVLGGARRVPNPDASGVIPEHWPKRAPPRPAPRSAVTRPHDWNLCQSHREPEDEPDKDTEGSE